MCGPNIIQSRKTARTNRKKDLDIFSWCGKEERKEGKKACSLNNCSGSFPCLFPWLSLSRGRRDEEDTGKFRVRESTILKGEIWQNLYLMEIKTKNFPKKELFIIPDYISHKKPPFLSLERAGLEADVSIFPKSFFLKKDQDVGKWKCVHTTGTQVGPSFVGF